VRGVQFEEDLGLRWVRTTISYATRKALSTLEILREQKIPKFFHILETSWRRYKNHLPPVKFIAAEQEPRAAYTVISTNRSARRTLGRQRQGHDPKLYATWNSVSTKLLEPDSVLRRTKRPAP
jgi:hypothetical protein